MSTTYYVVLVPQPEGGFFVECPALPGCYSQGESVGESLANIKEAIELVLEDLRATGQPIPDPAAPILAEVRIAG